MKRVAAFCLVACASLAMSQEHPPGSDADLATKLSNPVAAMVSVPLQFNYDQNYAGGDGHKTYVNVQPVIPFRINDDWNLITRNILPVADQSDVFPGSGSQSGLGDLTSSFFFSPVKPTDGGWIWAIGPVFYLPTATDDLLGAKKWGVGPTALMLKQEHGWTYGFLWNYVASVATVRGNNNDRPDLSNGFIQPFLSYSTPSAWTYGVNIEASHSWDGNQWSVPLNLSVGHVVHFGSTPVQVTLGTGYFLDHTDTGPRGWRFRFVTTFLIPEGH